MEGPGWHLNASLTTYLAWNFVKLFDHLFLLYSGLAKLVTLLNDCCHNILAGQHGFYNEKQNKSYLMAALTLSQRFSRDSRVWDYEWSRSLISKRVCVLRDHHSVLIFEILAVCMHVWIFFGLKFAFWLYLIKAVEVTMEKTVEEAVEKTVEAAVAKRERVESF